ncbi:MAG: hypothetical protein J4451_02075 [DPANN group archaeon]|nr:hypothetical protein [DPANN group archaeon]
MTTLVDLEIPKKYHFKIDIAALKALQVFSVSKPPAPQPRKTSLKVLHDMHFDPVAAFSHLELEGDFTLAFAYALRKLLKYSPEIPELLLIVDSYDKITVSQKDSAHQIFEKLHL